MTKTNVMRLLDAAGIAYSVREYDVDEDDLSGESTAHKLSLPAEQIFKTLVLTGEKNGIAVCCIPANEELDLKKAAKHFGEKKVEMLHVKDLLRHTGYIRGGCSPIGMKKLYPTAIDESAQLFDAILVSAGVRGAMIEIKPVSLAEYVHAAFVDVTEL